MLDPVYLACLAPEGQAQPDEFEDGSARLRKRASAQSPIKIHADLGPGRVEEKNSTRWAPPAGPLIQLKLGERTHHKVIKRVPWQLRVDDHARRDERGEKRAQRVARVQTPLHGIGVIHDPDPSAEARVRQPVAEAGDAIDDDQHGKRGVGG